MASNTSEKLLLRGGTIVTADSAGTIVSGGSILLDRGRVASIIPAGSSPQVQPGTEIVDLTNKVVIPGFVQTHLHLCQALFRGRADDMELLEWLKHRIFPFEAAHNADSMRASTWLALAELIRSGTTTILDMGSVHHEEEIINAVGESGIRAFVGKAMMDLNDLYPSLKESTAASLSTTRSLIDRWHASYDGRIRYAMAPRFVLSCTDDLLHQTKEMLDQYPGVLLHMHASENSHEIEAVRSRTGMENIVFLNHAGLLSNRSCLAHCIHLNDEEIRILQTTRANVTHCPSSNLKLASGIARIPHLTEKGINVSLGADGAPCNNRLDMFREMRLASLLQKPIHGATSMPAKTVFAMATIDGAKALGLENEIGSIEPGKKADLVVLDLNNVWDPSDSSENPYSAIVYSAGPENVDSVMVDGEWLYRKKEFLRLDKEKIVLEARAQLSRLLGRMH